MKIKLLVILLTGFIFSCQGPLELDKKLENGKLKISWGSDTRTLLPVFTDQISEYRVEIKKGDNVINDFRIDSTSETIELEIGDDYSLKIEALDSNGNVLMEKITVFSITNGETTTLEIILETLDSGSGSVNVNFNWPNTVSVDSVSAVWAGGETVNLEITPFDGNIKQVNYENHLAEKGSSLLLVTFFDVDANILSIVTESVHIYPNFMTSGIITMLAGDFSRAPDVPLNLSGTATTNTINLTWSDNSNTETSFFIEKSTDNLNFETVVTTAANVTSYEDSGLAADTVYYYRIQSVNDFGSSIWLNLEKSTLADTTAPSEVILGENTSTVDSITLNWTDPVETDFKEVEVSINDQIITVVKGIETLEVSGLAFGTEYPYTLKTKDNTGNYSTGITGTISTLADTTAPSEVFPGTNISTVDSITLNWSDPTDTDFKEVEVSINEQTITVAKSTETLEVTGLASGTEFTYTIKTKDDTGNISTGITGTISTLADTTAPSEVISGTNISTVDSITLNWSDPADTDFKEVEILINEQTITVAKSIETLEVTSLASGTEFTYSIKTIDHTGNISTGITGTISTLADTTAPSEVIPENIASTKTTVTLNWSDPVDTDFKEVEVSINGQTITVAKSIEILEVTGLASGSEFPYTIKTIDYTGNISTGKTGTISTLNQTGSLDITIVINDPEQISVVLSGIEAQLHLGNTLTVSTSFIGATGFNWLLDGDSIGTEETITIDSNTLTMGKVYNLTLIVTKNELDYSGSGRFTIVQ